MCIRGGALRAWFVLPTVEKYGRHFAALSCRMCWLHQVLGGPARRRLYQTPVADFVQECLAAFRDGAEPPSSTGFEPSDSPGSTSEGDKPRCHLPRTVGVAALGISASEDEGDGAEYAEGFEPSDRTPPKPRRGATPRLGELVNREVRGFMLTYTVGRGPKVLIPTDGPFIERIFMDLQPRALESHPGAEASSGESLAAREASSQDKGRVFWRGEGFQICYRDDEGNKRHSSAGLSMPRRGLTNEPLTVEEAERTKDALLKNARRKWNHLDQSGAQRFAA